MKLKDLAKQLSPKKLIRIEINRSEEYEEQHIFADITFALIKCAELEIVDGTEMPWTYVLKVDPNTDWIYPEEKKEDQRG